MKDNEKYSRLILAQIDGIGPATFFDLLKFYGSAKDCLEAILQKKNKYFLPPDRKVLNDCYKIDINSFVVFGEQSYPQLLAKIPDPPITLFFRGDFHALDFSRMISVVGTRNNSPEGARLTRKFTGELTAAGFVVVSGMAFGVDTIAHRTALDSGGKTLAVLGTRIDRPYPASNASIYNEIKQQGVVVSEFFFENDTQKYIFPRRNRIIAGLSIATLVVEAPLKSGALITADLAIDYNREVFAAPASVFNKKAEGSNNLIKNGSAKLVTGIEDIVAELDMYGKLHSRKEVEKLPEAEQSILDKIYEGSSDFDFLAEQLGLSANQIQIALTNLELKNLIAKNTTGNYTVLS